MGLSAEEAIVVLYYNKIKLTESCINSILDAGYMARDIYCFDNGSKAEVFEEVKQKYPLCRHHRCAENKGYSGGFNQALDWAFNSGISSVLFLTNDTIAYGGALEACSRTAVKTGAGMVAPGIVYLSDGYSIDSIGGWFDASTCMLNHYHNHGLPLILDPSKDYIPGTALWIHKDLFYQLGGTDETFHMYWEDVDLCFRANRENLPLARCYEAKIGHGVGQTCRKKPLYTTFYFHRNRVRFCKKYLEGDVLEQAINRLTGEFTKMGDLWEQKEDQKRLNYLEQLMEELRA